MRKSDLLHFKFALSVNKKYGQAHERNLIKRRLRMIIHKNMFHIDSQVIFVLVINPVAKQLDFAHLEQNVLFLLKKISRISLIIENKDTVDGYERNRK